MLTADFDYAMARDRIAQAPRPRGRSRLMVLGRGSNRVEHRRVAHLPGLLRRGDLLLVNDTKVIPARLWASRPTGRRFEVLLLRPVENGAWEAMLRPSARARVGETLLLADGGAMTPEERLGEGLWRLGFSPVLDEGRLDAFGETPLPPYIERPGGATPADRADYQTVYARRPGAVAAPTAGLHLTPEILAEAAARGVRAAALTLHVGLGTFRPVSVERVGDHHMHSEMYEVPSPTAAAVNEALAQGRRIVCVGTTTVRALEAALLRGDGVALPGPAATDLFITPSYLFRGVGALVTNFHLPRSSLLMMVSAFAGRERILAAYGEAMARGYRVYSYGDAMLIE